MPESDASAEPLVFRYEFRFADGRRQTFTIRVNPQTLELIQPPTASLPEWTALTYKQCPSCPLRPEQSPRCPAAVSLVELVNVFGSLRSIDEVDVRVEMAERQYVKRCALQEGLGSLLGLLMATSGCPVTAKLRPMARFHLPFSTTEETRYRVLSMYLLAQYFRAQRGQTPDWMFAQLVRFYEELSTVNKHLFARITSLVTEDANLNALVRLDALAMSVAFTVDQHLLEELEQLFRGYVDSCPAPPAPAE